MNAQKEDEANRSDRPARPRLHAIWYLAGVAALLWILATGRPPRATLLWVSAYDFGHIPLFGIMAVLLFEASRVLFGSSEMRGGNHYLIAFVVVAALSLLSEFVQIGVAGREAQARDAVNNMIGAGAFLALRAVWDRHRWESGDELNRRLLFAAATLVLLLALFPMVTLLWHYGMRAAAFPTLADFDAPWQQPFIEAPRVQRTVSAAPPAWKGRKGRPVVRVTFSPRPWPGILIREPYPDWTGYSVLRFQIFSDLDRSREVVLWINDLSHNDLRSDRYEETFSIEPGLNDFTVALQDLREAPAGREMRLDSVTFLMLFTRRPTDTFDLYLGDIWLE
jgi:VanZ family protein